MTRGKRLTPDEESEINRLKKEGFTVNEIEKKTGKSHTKIVELTKNIKPVFRSSKNVTSPAATTEAPTIIQGLSPQNRNTMTPPSKTGYYIEPGQGQYPFQGIPITSPSMNYGQKQYPGESMDTAGINHNYGQYQQIQEETKRREQHQLEEGKKDREHEEWMAQKIQEMRQLLLKQQKQSQEQKQKQEEEATIQYLKRERKQQDERNIEIEKTLQDTRAQPEKSRKTPVQQETMQPSIMTPAPPDKLEKNNTTEPNEIPVKENLAYISEEPRPVDKPTLHTSPLQNFGRENTDKIQQDNLESAEGWSLSDAALFTGITNIICEGIINPILESNKPKIEESTNTKFSDEKK